MACVSSTRVLGGWLWSRRSRWPCHGMSKVSVLFIDGGTHRKSGFVIGRYGNMIPRLAERAVHCTRIFPLPPRFDAVPYPPSGCFLLTHTTAPFNLPERGRRRISTLSSIPKDEYHFASRHGVQRARLAFRMKLYIWRPSFRRWAKNGAVRSPTFFLDSILPAYLWILFCHLFFILFFFSRNFCEDYLILEDSVRNLAFFVSLWLKDNSKNSKFYIMLDYTNFNWFLINRITGASIFTPTFL